MNSLVALSYGWSIIGSQSRAWLGQFSLNALHSPNLFGMSRKPAGRRAVIRDGEHDVAAGRRRSRERERQHVVLMNVGHGLSAARDGRHSHAFAVGARAEIERDPGDAVLREAQIHRRFTGDFRARVRDLQPERVVPGVDAGLARVGVGERGRRGQDEHESRQDQG